MKKTEFILNDKKQKLFNNFKIFRFVTNIILLVYFLILANFNTDIILPENEFILYLSFLTLLTGLLFDSISKEYRDEFLEN